MAWFRNNTENATVWGSTKKKLINDCLLNVSDNEKTTFGNLCG